MGFTKTFAVPLAHTAISHPGSLVGDDQVATTDIYLKVVMQHASVEATANTDPGSFVVETSGEETGDDSWAIQGEYPANDGTAATEAMTATEGSGETVLAVASTTGFAAVDKAYIEDTTTIGNSEWREVEQIVSNVSIDIVDGLTTGKDSADVIWNNTDTFTHAQTLAGGHRWRVRFRHEGTTGANVHVRATAVITTAFS